MQILTEDAAAPVGRALHPVDDFVLDISKGIKFSLSLRGQG